MNVQEVQLELTRWHELIKPDLSDDELIKLYKGLILEETRELQEADTIGNIVKECCDLMVVCEPVVRLGVDHDKLFAYELSRAATRMLGGHSVNWWVALSKVNQSNFSKLVLEDEVENALAYLEGQGIEVFAKHLGDGYFGCYSSRNQIKNGKEYKKNKLLKTHKYWAIDENKDWWK